MYEYGKVLYRSILFIYVWNKIVCLTEGSTIDKNILPSTIDVKANVGHEEIPLQSTNTHINIL